MYSAAAATFARIPKSRPYVQLPLREFGSYVTDALIAIL